MIDLGLLSSALGSVQAVSDITRSMIGLKNAADVNAKAIELQTIIITLQGEIARAIGTQSQLAQENERLKSQLMEAEDFRSDASRYKLLEPWPGIFVYACRYNVRDGEPAHYICANCYQHKKKSLLQIVLVKGWLNFTCPTCSATLPTESRGGVEMRYVHD